MTMSSTESPEPFEGAIFPYSHEYFSQVKKLIEASGLQCETHVLPEIGYVCLGVNEPYLGAVAGYIGGHIKYHQHARIDMLVVDEMVRNHLIGVRLIQHMLKSLNSLGIKSIDGEVEADNRTACRMYEKLGATLVPRETFQESVPDILNKIDARLRRIFSRRSRRNNTSKE